MEETSRLNAKLAFIVVSESAVPDFLRHASNSLGEEKVADTVGCGWG